MFQDRIEIFNVFEGLSDVYKFYCRVFRNEYKWAPSEIERMSVRDMVRIFEETLEDAKDKAEGLDG